VIYALGERRVKTPGRFYVAQSATVVGSVVLENDVSVWFNAVIRGDNDQITVGEGSNVQDGAVLHADPGFPLKIGRGVTIGHQAMLHGCTVGDGSLIGIQATVLNGAVIGEQCVIGAQAFVPEGREIPPRSLVLGSPGRVIRTLSEDDLEPLRDAARHYVEKITAYTEGLRQDPR
jgi:carbonic anhydrase/acetyltransferase-like protein (isoleucine patch superfamily)